jgi:hypothetical protein
MIRSLLVLVLASFLIGCKGLNSYYTHDRFQREIRSSYERDTLGLSDYFICSHQRQETLFGTEFEERLTDDDSILNQLVIKIGSQGIHLAHELGVNIADSELCNRHVIKIKHVEKKIPTNSLNNTENVSRIITFLEIADIYRFTGYMTSNLVAGDGGFRKYTSISLIIFIVKNGEVIYSDHRRYASKRTMANSLEEVRAIPPAYQVREEHIDELVRRAMKRYVRRLEK